MDTAWLCLKTAASSPCLYLTCKKASCCHVVVIGALTAVLLGAVAPSRIPTDILPTFRTRAVQILTLYPTMPTEVMERDITSRLERWTGQANGVARQESRSMTGVSVFRDYFRPDIDPNTAISQA